MFTIFLSHRHVDNKIADTLRQHIMNFGVPCQNIFQASSYIDGLPPGANVEDELLGKIRETDLFIFIYTNNDEDNQYCFWELGVAHGADTKKTNTVVIQCTDHEPRLRKAYLRVKVAAVDTIKSFVWKVHRDPTFVAPDDAVREHSKDVFAKLGYASDILLEQRATKLAQDLQTAATLALGSRPPEVLHRLDFLDLRPEAESASEIIRLRADARRFE